MGARISSIVAVLFLGWPQPAMAEAPEPIWLADHINVDFDYKGVDGLSVNGSPQDYAGAGASPGFWNDVSSLEAENLTNYWGLTTPVGVVIDPHSVGNEVDFLFRYETGDGPVGEAEMLYGDFIAVDAGAPSATKITLTDLDPEKSYRVFVYAWARPRESGGGEPNVKTRIRINGGAALDIGGEYPNDPSYPDHNPQTHFVSPEVLSGVSEIEIEAWGAGGRPGVVNGLQLREWNEVPPSRSIPPCKPLMHPAVADSYPETTAYGSVDPATGRHPLAARDLLFVTTEVSFKTANGVFKTPYGFHFFSDTLTVKTPSPPCMSGPTRFSPGWANRDMGSINQSLDRVLKETIDLEILSGQPYVFQTWFRTTQDLDPGWSAPLVLEFD